MAAMVRLLASRTHLETTPEEVAREKVAFQVISREFYEADEENLLEEEDMHVFDSRPMTDPLHLVSCNACKKPIKASQYALHAERCMALNHSEDSYIELDGGHKKLMKKGRKKMQMPADNQGSHNGEKEKTDSMDGDGMIGFGSNLDDNAEDAGTISHISRKVKRVVSDVPAPLATKLYYLRGSHRLRAALNHLYYQSSERDISIDSSLRAMQGNNMHDVGYGYSAKHPHQNFSKGSDLCIGGPGTFITDLTSTKQFHEGDLSVPGRSITSNTPIMLSSGR